MGEEGLTKTQNDLIYIGKPLEFDETSFMVSVRDLMDAAYRNVDDMKERVAGIVDTYKMTADQG